jgi:hypothetical protein
MSTDPLAHIRALAERDPVTWAPALAEHERQLASQSTTKRASKPIGLPPLWRQVVTFLRALALHIRAGLPKTHQASVKARWRACQACPKYQAESERCGACGCFLRSKIAWELSECPEGRW